MNECRITDIHNYPHAPCFALSASGSQNRSSSRPVHTFFKPAERYGACFTAQNGGFVNASTFNNQSLMAHAWSKWGYLLLLLPGWNNTVNNGTWTHKTVTHTYIHTYIPCTSVFARNLFNPLGPIAPISVMRLSASWCHFRQCPWDLGSAW